MESLERLQLQALFVFTVWSSAKQPARFPL